VTRKAPKKSDLTRLLGEVDIFAELSGAELSRVAALAKPMSFEAGEKVVEIGAPGGRFFLVSAGEAKVMVNGRVRRTLTPGMYFGEISLIDGEPRSADVVATQPLATYSIAEWNFRPLLKTHPTIAYKLAVILCGLLRAEQRIGAAS
jgi:CRP/FNR family transcriptional regulator, cyclic AMP receptor protein